MRLVAVGGSDAGIAAALRARELDPDAEVTVVLADRYPNFSICGIPYYISREVGDRRHLAHRSVADLQAAGIALRLDTVVRRIDPERRLVFVDGPGVGLGVGDGDGDGAEAEAIEYDALVIGPVPSRPDLRSRDRTIWTPPTECTCCIQWTTRSR